MSRRAPRARLGLLGAVLLALTAAAAPSAYAHPGHDHGDAAAPLAPPEDFQQVTLAIGEPEMGEPMGLDILPDGTAVHTSRDGTVRLTDSDGTTTVAGVIPVYTHDEEGLQGVAVDPDFAANRHIFLYYAPPLDTPPGDAPAGGGDFAAWEGVNRLSRFTLSESGRLDMGSEVTVLEVPADRGICCHAGGDMDFDAEGNLYLSTGDDTNPFESDGYTPIDERADRNPAFDAQRTSGNTNDLRGKILRITVNDDGSYSIPEGNLFAPGTADTRPEIYAMGFRNPFRISVDQETGVVYVGDYGPDAGAANPDRGPAGQVEFARVDAPGNYGWPYCTGSNTAEETYVDYDFATQTSGSRFDCAAPVNDSPRNTGLTQLPPAEPAWIPYNGGSVPEFGNGSESPMGGPVYHFDPELDSAVKFPEEYDGQVFLAEYGRRWIRSVTVNGDGSAGTIAEFPWAGTQPMDLAFGPEGALYVLDYGTGYFNGDHNSALYRIEYAPDGQRPNAVASADVTSGQAPLEVRFSSEGTSDPDSTELAYAWDFGDGGTSTEPNPSHTYTADGDYTATLTVTDEAGLTGTASVPITVGNTAPQVEVVLPAEGQLFEFGDEVAFEIEVTDPEDGEIDCSQVTVSYILGHDSHGHGLAETSGCSGTIQTPVDGEHDPNANIFGIIDAEYTDAGGLSGSGQNILQPRHRQGEHFGDASGVQVVQHTNAEGAATVGHIENGDWIAFEPYLLADAASFTARVASAGTGGTIEVRAGAPDGPLLGSVEAPVTGDWETFTEVTTSLSGGPAETTSLYLVFTGGAGALFDVDSFTIE
ncbi:PQQ-dependent sugar dehydrogenase [Allonocardiopsis opalescens]|uniref:Glucose/arabinose dehydrogenase n=1 Tax=Allonocardiopsis opalescens TaxID=1144618 RepID=A0A2T0Q0C5_9ACTN|nr:PQQ-dependent sugar dehydrogenase [Allonocardiopsis opalescens]PRX97123.1 glucose/arabinose dehydrogenase [Allonocardiopsis opalescens]